MIKNLFGIDNKTMDTKKCNCREINVSFTLIIDESCLDGTRVLCVPCIWEDGRRNKKGIPISKKKKMNECVI